MKAKLIKGYDDSVRVPVVSVINGRNRHHYILLKPNESKEIDNEHVSRFKEFTVKQKKTAGLVQLLENANVEYKTITCGSCGSRADKLQFNPIVVEGG